MFNLLSNGFKCHRSLILRALPWPEQHCSSGEAPGQPPPALSLGNAVALRAGKTALNGPPATDESTWHLLRANSRESPTGTGLSVALDWWALTRRPLLSVPLVHTRSTPAWPFAPLPLLGTLSFAAWGRAECFPCKKAGEVEGKEDFCLSPQTLDTWQG